MSTDKTKKTDRRTKYTRMVITEALLSLLSEKEYPDITVADICRTAEISRGTFYIHYNNIRDVLDELFDEAMKNTHGLFTQIDCDIVSDARCTYPLCRLLRENKKYQPLFFSDSLHSYVIERTVAMNKEHFLSGMMKHENLTEEELLNIYYFQLNGCLAISKKNADLPDERWAEIQSTVDRLLKNGLQNI